MASSLDLDELANYDSDERRDRGEYSGDEDDAHSGGGDWEVYKVGYNDSSATRTSVTTSPGSASKVQLTVVSPSESKEGKVKGRGPHNRLRLDPVIADRFKRLDRGQKPMEDDVAMIAMLHSTRSLPPGQRSDPVLRDFAKGPYRREDLVSLPAKRRRSNEKPTSPLEADEEDGDERRLSKRPRRTPQPKKMISPSMDDRKSYVQRTPPKGSATPAKAHVKSEEKKYTPGGRGGKPASRATPGRNGNTPSKKTPTKRETEEEEEEYSSDDDYSRLRPTKLYDTRGESLTMAEKDETLPKTKDGEFEVAEIMDHRRVPGANKTAAPSMEYYVRWRWCTEKYWTWEPAENLENCQAKIVLYWEKYAKKQAKAAMGGAASADEGEASMEY